MRRVWIALTVLAAATALALPAAAVKPDGPPGLDKPPAETGQYTVTMKLIGESNGIATSAPCTEGGALTMELSSQGDLGPVDAVPFLEVQVGSELNWYRHYPYFRTPSLVPDGFDPNEYPLGVAQTGSGLSGCHGGGVDVTIIWLDGAKALDDTNSNRSAIVQSGNLFWLIPSDGDVGLLWHSDYYREWENVGKKKPRYIANDIEDFTYSGSFDWWTDESMQVPVVWDPMTGASGIVSGNMRISYFRPGSYTPFEEGGEIGFPVKFLLNISPIEE